MGYFIAVNTKNNKVLTSGQSIYGWESGARRGIGQFIPEKNRADYVVVEITPEDVAGLLARNGINASDN
jgi:hypothetical protein